MKLNRRWTHAPMINHFCKAVLRRIGPASAILLALNGCTTTPVYTDQLTWEELQSLSRGDFVYRGSSGRKEASLTFDDGPSRHSELILDVLRRHGVRGTFFWQGKNFSAHQPTVARAIAEGHQIGNHSWNHPNSLGRTPRQLWQQQVEPTGKLFRKLTGQQMQYFRPPFGAITERQVAFLARRGMVTVGWSITSLDWDDSRNDRDEVVAKVLGELHPGAIILLHDYERPDDAPAMLEALETIIQTGRLRGYRWVTVNKLVSADTPP